MRFFVSTERWILADSLSFFFFGFYTGLVLLVRFSVDHEIEVHESGNK